MNHSYSQAHILTQPLGNNAFAWQEREVLYGKSPTLTIPSLIDGTLDDVILGEDIVFEEIEDGQIRSCKGLQNFVRLFLPPPDKGELEGVTQNGTSYSATPPNLPFSREGWNNTPQEVTIFDNHNHALYFWFDAIRQGIIEPGFELIHIDEHSDLWPNPHNLHLDKAITDEQYAWEFTNLECNVGNYIQPAIQSGLISNMIRIENEFQIDEYMNYTPPTNTILNIDIDIFAPELDHIPDEKKMQIIKNLLKRVKYVTIATSPYFIDQGRAIQKIRKILP